MAIKTLILDDTTADLLNEIITRRQIELENAASIAAWANLGPAVTPEWLDTTDHLGDYLKACREWVALEPLRLAASGSAQAPRNATEFNRIADHGAGLLASQSRARGEAMTDAQAEWYAAWSRDIGNSIP